MFGRVSARARRREGFTLIELLVVIVIIGILAAMAISAYVGQRHKAEDAATVSVVRSAMITIESAYADVHDFSAIVDDDLKKIETSIAFTDAANAATAPTADAGTNTVDWHATGPAAYELGSRSESGKRYGVIVDKNASGGNTFYVNGEVHDW